MKSGSTIAPLLAAAVAACPEGFVVEGSCREDWYREFDSASALIQKASRPAFDILKDILPSGNEDFSRHDLPALARWADTDSQFKMYQDSILPQTNVTIWVEGS